MPTDFEISSLKGRVAQLENEVEDHRIELINLANYIDTLVQINNLTKPS